jgi:hypothetical protein
MHEAEKRSVRRHHLERIKQRRSNYYSLASWQIEAEAKKRHLGRIANTAKLCSCWMCGNPRNHRTEKTLNELSATEVANLFV